jgi:hypothetical protein
VDKRAWRCLAGAQRTGTGAHRCSLAVVEEDEAVLEGCSPEHEQQRRGGTMEEKNGGGLSSSRGRRKMQESSGERGKGAVRAGVLCALL